MQKEITIGTLVACVNYSYSLIWPMRLLGWLANIIAQAVASIHKMEEILIEKIEDEDMVTNKGVCEFDIKFENVGFTYNDKQILHDINLDIKHGQTVAIMGISGAGKTSLVNLLTKTYNVTSGKIWIGSHDINSIDLLELRNHISLVMQDTFLFSASIRDNINIGVDQFDEDRLRGSVLSAKVDEFLPGLENGLDTVIGERGIGLSGGQKQRVSIARAVIRPCKVLILDDSTSALDTHTEYDIQRNLDRAVGITKIIIAHRISATKSADKIVIMNDGTIVEQGSHNELMAIKGHYYETYMEQFRGLLELKEEVVANA